MGLTSLYFSSNGRISRKVYWMASLPLLAFSIFLELLIGTVVTRDEATLFSIIVLLVLVVPTIMLCIKRFHDRDKSGWFALVNFIPLIGPLWLLVELGFLRGTKGSNRFGSDPLAEMSDADRYTIVAGAH